MTSYNRLGTQWAGGSYSLLTTVLRGEWGFKGYTSSDYARSNTEMFVKAISVMGEVGDFFDETGKINNLQSRTQTIAKEAEKKDKK